MEEKEEAKKEAKSESSPPTRSRSGRSRSPRGADQEKGSSAPTTDVLHRGEMLGELPALGRTQGTLVFHTHVHPFRRSELSASLTVIRKNDYA